MLVWSADSDSGIGSVVRRLFYTESVFFSSSLYLTIAEMRDFLSLRRITYSYGSKIRHNHCRNCYQCSVQCSPFVSIPSLSPTPVLIVHFASFHNLPLEPHCNPSIPQSKVRRHLRIQQRHPHLHLHLRLPHKKTTLEPASHRVRSTRPRHCPRRSGPESCERWRWQDAGACAF